MDFYEKNKTITQLLDYQSNLLQLIISDTNFNNSENKERIKKVSNRIEELLEI
jgi:hypothetical protein